MRSNKIQQTITMSPNSRRATGQQQIARKENNMDEIKTQTATRLPTIAALRRKAARKGYKLTKLRSDSRWHLHYGPFMIVERSTKGGVSWGLSLEEAAEWLANAK